MKNDKTYIIVVGTSALVDYDVLTDPGNKKRYIAKISSSYICPHVFKNKTFAEEVAKHFGGAVVEGKTVEEW